jgi:hypothetical protein
MGLPLITGRARTTNPPTDAHTSVNAAADAFTLLLLLLRRFFPCIQQFADIKLIARSAVRTQLIARPFC